MTGWSQEELVGCQAPFPYWPRDNRDALQQTLGLTLAGNAPATGFEKRPRR